MLTDRIEADYLLETPIDPRCAAEIMAGEQSSGTFVAVPGETPELKERSAARVTALDVLDDAVAQRSLPSAGGEREGERITRAKVTLSWPLATLGPSLPNLLATVAGNLFELKPVSGLRLLDIRMPSAFAEAYPGPLFGHVIEAEADRTGKKPMFAFNLTGELDQMRRRHDTLLAHGATCLMASLNSVGLVGMIELRRFSQLPIHAHRNGWGYLSRHPLLGWSYVAWQKIWRLAGADHMHVNGLQNKFSETDESVIEAARACLTPMFADKPCVVMPVFSSGQSARQIPPTYAALQSPDFIMTAGGGIMAHPDGPAAGVRSMREAWDAARAGIPLEEHARTHPDLGRALEIAA
ncbi:MAG: ribulose bisphosphate carboxylase large chain, catalytic domain protein [Microvirga sp.]|nr:ribulose bisphosphate carboxylase large chain, catalytic domain protein [Microvirga sp.]